MREITLRVFSRMCEIPSCVKEALKDQILFFVLFRDIHDIT